MGSYDGPLCEVIGINIIKKLTSIINKNDVGLYRDDGLCIVKNCNSRSTEKQNKKFKKKLSKPLDLQ